MPYTDSLPGLECPRCEALSRELASVRADLGAAAERIVQLTAECAEKSAAIEQQSRDLQVLREKLEELEREAHRQAAPFRREESKRKESKGKAGRKPGHRGHYRPPPLVVTEEARVPLDCCPHCQGAVEDVRPITQVIEDIPQIVLRRLRLTTYRGRCAKCGLVHSTHPEQVSTATGAAGTHLGKNALALATYLNKALGLTMRKTCQLLQDGFGLRITPGGLSQAMGRVAGKVQDPYCQLLQQLHKSPAVYVDETGWWVGGQSRWLWTFADPRFTLYAIGDRSNAMRRSMLSDDYKGVLVSDCLNIYDAFPGRKSKCCAHHLKAIREALDQAPDSRFLNDIKAFFKSAILWHRMLGEVTDEVYQDAVNHLHQRLDWLLSDAGDHPAAISIRNRLLKQRPHLLTFLTAPGVDPTNNLAERQLRPAVITRKLSCGNKTLLGQFTFEILASIAATAQQNRRSFIDFIAGYMPLVAVRPPPLSEPFVDPAPAQD